MADPDGLASYILAIADSDLTNSRTFAADGGSGLATSDFGPEGNYVISTINALEKINSLGTQGIVVGVTASPYFYTRQITSGDGSIQIINPAGLDGDIDLSISSGHIQSINFQCNNSPFGSGSTINFVPGAGINITPAFDSGTNTATYTLISSIHGTVTSVGIDSTSGLTITNSPITSSGVISVNLPTGTLHQVLRIASVSPQVLEFADPSGGGGPPVDSTYLCQDGTDLPLNGINLGANGAVLGIGLTAPTSPLDINAQGNTFSTIHVVNDPQTNHPMSLSYTNYGGSSPNIDYFTSASRGTKASPTQVINGDLLYEHIIFGRGSSSFLPSAIYYCTATEDFATNHGTSLIFETTPTGTSVTNPILTLQGKHLGINNTTPASPLDIVSVSDTAVIMSMLNDPQTDSTAQINWSNYGGATPGIDLTCTSSRGTLSSPSQIIAGDTLFKLDFMGRTSSGYGRAGGIELVAAENFSLSQGSTLYLKSTGINDNLTTRTMALQGPTVSLPNNGSLFGVGTVSGPRYPLDVYASSLGAFPIASFISDPGTDSESIINWTNYGRNLPGVNLNTTAVRGALGSPLPILAADILYRHDVYGRGSTGSTLLGAYHTAVASQDYGATDCGTAMYFFTTPNNTATPIQTLELRGTLVTINPAGVSSTSNGPLVVNYEQTGNGNFGIAYYNYKNSHTGYPTVDLFSAPGSAASPGETLANTVLGRYGVSAGASSSATYGAGETMFVSRADFTGGDNTTSFLVNLGCPGAAPYLTTFLEIQPQPDSVSSYLTMNQATPDSMISARNFYQQDNVNLYMMHLTGTGQDLTSNPAWYQFDCHECFNYWQFNSIRNGSALIGDDIVGQFVFGGSVDGSANVLEGIWLLGTVAGGYGVGSVPSNFYIATASTGSPVPNNYFSFSSTGTLGIGQNNGINGIGAYQIDCWSSLNQSVSDYAAARFISKTGSGPGVYGGIALESYTSFSAIRSKSSRGTKTSPTAIQNGDIIAGYYASGQYDTTAGHFGDGGGLVFTAKENFSSGHYGTAATLNVTKTATGSPITVMTVDGGTGTGASQDGRVGIGITPTYQLQLGSDSASKPGVGGLWTVTSDARIKTNIQDLNGSLAIINQLQPRTFNFTKEYDEAWKTIAEGSDAYDPLNVHTGFIADEIMQVLPETVKEGQDPAGLIDNLKVLNAGVLIPHLVAAIKELNARIAVLEAK